MTCVRVFLGLWGLLGVNFGVCTVSGCVGALKSMDFERFRRAEMGLGEFFLNLNIFVEKLLAVSKSL
jgi:hypothetical protein